MPPLALAVIFLLLGLGILIAEVFLPSGGILAILTFAALGASISAAYSGLWETHPEWFWAYVGVVVASVPTTVLIAFWVLPRTPFGRRMMLEGPKPEEVDPYAEERERLQKLVGTVGTAVTPHMPGGIVEVGGERLHADARGPLPAAGDRVEIVAIEGRRVIVKRATEPTTTEAAAGPAAEAEPTSDDESLFPTFDDPTP
ncbi:MAG: NfeD family protein [Planctomycetota bacterium]